MLACRGQHLKEKKTPWKLQHTSPVTSHLTLPSVVYSHVFTKITSSDGFHRRGRTLCHLSRVRLVDQGVKFPGDYSPWQPGVTCKKLPGLHKPGTYSENSGLSNNRYTPGCSWISGLCRGVYRNIPARIHGFSCCACCTVDQDVKCKCSLADTKGTIHHGNHMWNANSCLASPNLVSIQRIPVHWTTGILPDTPEYLGCIQEFTGTSQTRYMAFHPVNHCKESGVSGKILAQETSAKPAVCQRCLQDPGGFQESARPKSYMQIIWMVLGAEPSFSKWRVRIAQRSME